eukprot:3635482-Prymnesium_polylepis.1
MGPADVCACACAVLVCAVLGVLTWGGALRAVCERCCRDISTLMRSVGAPSRHIAPNVALRPSLLTPSPSHLRCHIAAVASSHLPFTPPRSRTASLPPRKAARPTPARRTPRSRGTRFRPSPGPP